MDINVKELNTFGITLNVVGRDPLHLKVNLETCETYQAISDSRELIKEILHPRPTEDEDNRSSTEVFCDICEKLAKQGQTIKKVIEQCLNPSSWIELSKIYDILPYQTLLKLYKAICDAVEDQVVKNLEEEAQSNGL